jgi:hypothetical protein
VGWGGGGGELPEDKIRQTQKYGYIHIISLGIFIISIVFSISIFNIDITVGFRCLVGRIINYLHCTSLRLVCFLAITIL